MNKFSKKSKQRLSECENILQNIFTEALQIMDISIVCGHRTKPEQNRAYYVGNSKLKWPKSKHNKHPSLAIDVIPYPQQWGSKEHFYMLNGIVQAIAKKHGANIRWGGDWDRDNDFRDNRFNDLAHWELID